MSERLTDSVAVDAAAVVCQKCEAETEAATTTATASECSGNFTMQPRAKSNNNTKQQQRTIDTKGTTIAANDGRIS